MNKCKKILLVMAIFSAVTVSLKAELPPSTWGRLDIDAEKAKIKLEPVKEVLKNANCFHAKWRKEKQDYYLSSRVFFKKDVWKSVKVGFKPEDSGEVKLMFLGAYRNKALKEKIGFPWFVYKNIKIDGKEISLDDDKWFLKDDADFITSKDADEKDVKCLKAKCHSPAYYMINVEKDKVVTIEFDVKFFK